MDLIKLTRQSEIVAYLRLFLYHFEYLNIANMPLL